MLHSVFSVRDGAADAFLPPFVLPAEAVAVREFVYCANLPDHRFCVHARDFSLYVVGSFDDADGKLIPLAEPRFVMNAATAKRPVVPAGLAVNLATEV